jgi:single-strand DNA-binding protein
MINEVRLIGNVGADPEIVSVPSGYIAKINVATTDNWKDRHGVWQSKTQWHKCAAFGFMAEYVDKYIKKGDQVFIAGGIEYSSYERDGVTVHATEIKIKKIKKLGVKENV